MTTTGIGLAASERLILSKSPAAEIAAAALDAQKDAGLEGQHADFIVVAVPAGELGNVVDAVRLAAAAS